MILTICRTLTILAAIYSVIHVATAQPRATEPPLPSQSSGSSNSTQFEVATIKLTDPSRQIVGMFNRGGGRISTWNFTLKMLVEAANDFDPYTALRWPLRQRMQCRGSDGWSGVTANPALGLAMDTLIALGGTAILSEAPEIFGAEHLLTSRAEASIAVRLMERIAWWEKYAARHNNTLNNNPSPGNKLGGITTILEKSLGAVAKAGSSPLRAVVRYAEPPPCRGLIFMDSPGYDPVSATGQIASGANVLCFTTGRGSVFGAKPVPCLKLCTTTQLYRRMSDDMDINCGTILDGAESLSSVASRIYSGIIQTASGRLTKSEELGFGEEEFQPWLLNSIL